jgi:hypothetical protein
LIVLSCGYRLLVASDHPVAIGGPVSSHVVDIAADYLPIVSPILAMDYLR